jgi:hypothetical protein
VLARSLDERNDQVLVNIYLQVVVDPAGRKAALTFSHWLIREAKRLTRRGYPETAFCTGEDASLMAVYNYGKHHVAWSVYVAIVGGIALSSPPRHGPRARCMLEQVAIHSEQRAACHEGERVMVT